MLAKELAEILMKNPEAIVLRGHDGADGYRVFELSYYDIESGMQAKGNGFYSANIDGEKVPTITFA